MEIMDSIRAAFKELIVPELDKIKEENREIKAVLEVTNKRLDDVTIHLADQSRRIDAIREELTGQIGTVREELTTRIDTFNAQLISRLDAVRDELISLITSNNLRLDRLFESIVKRDEHSSVQERVTALERDVNELKRRLAA